MPLEHAGRPKLKKYVKGRLLNVYCSGLYTDWENRVYRVYTPFGITLSAWKRLEPVNGGRAYMAYDPGNGIGKTVHRKDGSCLYRQRRSVSGQNVPPLPAE